MSAAEGKFGTYTKYLESFKTVRVDGDSYEKIRESFQRRQTADPDMWWDYAHVSEDGLRLINEAFKEILLLPWLFERHHLTEIFEDARFKPEDSVREDGFIL